MLRVVGDRTAAAFIATVDLNTPQGCRDGARMRSVNDGAASAWLETTPLCGNTRLSTPECASVGVRRLGADRQSSVSQALCTCGSGAADAACHGQMLRPPSKIGRYVTM